MRYPLVLICSLLLTSTLVADDNKIVLPTNTVTVAPVPVPLPTDSAVTKLASDEWYVVTSQVPLLVFSFPEGVLTIDRDSGPQRIRGKFAGGTGAIETRVFSAPFVYLITANKSGTVELALVPKNAESEADAIRQTLTVSGTGPQPPPKPVDPPAPVNPPTPKPPEGFRVLLLIDETCSLDQANAVNSLQLIKWLDENCTKDGGKPDWRMWDRTTISGTNELSKETELWQKLWAEVASKVPSGAQVLVIADTDVKVFPIIDSDSLLRNIQAVKDGDL